MMFCMSFGGREWIQGFGVVVSGGNGKQTGDNDEMMVHCSFTIHTSIHLILYNSDWHNGNGDTRAFPIIKLVFSPLDHLFCPSLSSVFKNLPYLMGFQWTVVRMGRDGWRCLCSSEEWGWQGRCWVNHSLLLPISTFPHNFRQWCGPWPRKVGNWLP